MPDWAEEQPLCRLSLLIGESGVTILKNAVVFLCGVGGVGSWAAEILIRSGIGHLVMMDDDIVKPSNLNRQLCALTSTLGRPKVQVMAERLRDIMPSSEIIPLQHHLQPEECEQLIEKYGLDCVIDAIDERPSKLALIAACKSQGIPIVSSMGAANKLHTSLIQAADISETSGCRLARITRKNLRRMGIEDQVRTVFSPELPVHESIEIAAENEGEKRPLGTIAYLPAVFGMKCAEEAIRILLEKGGENL